MPIETDREWASEQKEELEYITKSAGVLIEQQSHKQTSLPISFAAWNVNYQYKNII